MYFDTNLLKTIIDNVDNIEDGSYKLYEFGKTLQVNQFYTFRSVSLFDNMGRNVLFKIVFGYDCSGFEKHIISNIEDNNSVMVFKNDKYNSVTDIELSFNSSHRTISTSITDEELFQLSLINLEITENVMDLIKFAQQEIKIINDLEYDFSYIQVCNIKNVSAYMKEIIEFISEWS